MLLGAILMLTGGAPAGAASNGKWSVFPTTLPGHSHREAFHPVLTPGKAYRDAMTVSNFTDAPLSFNLYAADAINTPGGGLSLRRRTDVQRDIGKWTSLPYTLLTVPAHSATVVPFTIVAPPQATPGDHVGGIVAEQTQGTTSQRGSTPITVIQAVGVRVYGRVVGPLHPRLALSGLSLAASTSGVTAFDGRVDAHVRFRVRNAGNTVLSPVATVVLTTPVGTTARRTFKISQLLPGSSLTYSYAFPGVNTFGHLRAEVTLSGQGARASAAETVWTIPWALLAVVAGLVLIAVFALRRRRRKRRQKRGPDEVPEAKDQEPVP